MEKIRYEIDPHNRLVMDQPGLKRFRRVLDGRFKVGEDNSLIYYIKAPLQDGSDTPHQVKLKGSWSLAGGNNLVFTLDEWKRQTFGDQLTLQTDIIDAKANSFVFALTTRSDDNIQSTYILELGGAWQADEKNRLAFRIKRERSRYDILTLEGAWEIDKNHEIVYMFRKERLARKKEEAHTIIFKGHWDINRRHRISYILDAGTDSVFDFRTGLGIFEDDYIKYEVGIGLANRPRPTRRIIILDGTWHLKKDASLFFEIEYADKKFYSITFGADVKLTENDTLSFKLKDAAGTGDIGASLKLSHKMLKPDGDLFLELLKSKGGEAAVMAGAAWRW